jgi:hypothetical protein
MEPCSWNSTRVQVSDFEGMSDGFLVNTGLQAKTRTGPSSTSSLVLDNERGELVEATVRMERKRVAVVSRPEFRIHDRHIDKVPYLCESKLTCKLILQNSIRVQRSTNNKINFII